MKIKKVLYPGESWWALCGQLGVVGPDGRGIAPGADLIMPHRLPLLSDMDGAGQVSGLIEFCAIVDIDGVNHVAMSGKLSRKMDGNELLKLSPEISFQSTEFDEDGRRMERRCEHGPDASGALWLTRGEIWYLFAGSKPALLGTRFGLGKPPWDDVA